MHSSIFIFFHSKILIFLQKKMVNVKRAWQVLNWQRGFSLSVISCLGSAVFFILKYIKCYQSFIQVGCPKGLRSNLGMNIE